MKASRWKQAGLALALLGSVTWAAAARGAGEGRPFAFGTPPVNSMGVTSMADLLGKPVLIDFWGTR
jgi:hypothetical protein